MSCGCYRVDKIGKGQARSNRRMKNEYEWQTHTVLPLKLLPFWKEIAAIIYGKFPHHLNSLIDGEQFYFSFFTEIARFRLHKL